MNLRRFAYIRKLARVGCEGSGAVYCQIKHAGCATEVSQTHFCLQKWLTYCALRAETFESLKRDVCMTPFRLAGRAPPQPRVGGPISDDERLRSPGAWRGSVQHGVCTVFTLCQEWVFRVAGRRCKNPGTNNVELVWSRNDCVITIIDNAFFFGKRSGPSFL